MNTGTAETQLEHNRKGLEGLKPIPMHHSSAPPWSRVRSRRENQEQAALFRRGSQPPFSILMVFLHFINIFPQSEKNKPPWKSGQTQHAHLLQEPTCTALVHSVWCLSSQIKPFLIWHEGRDPQGSEEQLQLPPSASSMASPATQTARAGSALLPGATHPHSSSLAASRLTVPHPSLFQLPGLPEQTIHSQC